MCRKKSRVVKKQKKSFICFILHAQVLRDYNYGRGCENVNVYIAVLEFIPRGLFCMNLNPLHFVSKSFDFYSTHLVRIFLLKSLRDFAQSKISFCIAWIYTYWVRIHLAKISTWST